MNSKTYIYPQQELPEQEQQIQRNADTPEEQSRTRTAPQPSPRGRSKVRNTYPPEHMVKPSMRKTYALLRLFRLGGIARTLELRLTEAQEDNMAYSEFLDLLLDDEKTNREDNRRKRLYQAAKLPFEKSLDTFDFSFQPSIRKGEIVELATCKYLEKHENILFIGQPGTGKTHLSVSLGLKALGYGYKVLFTTVWDMITTLQHSRADHTYKKKISYYASPDLLILDELGYKSMGETTVEDFFEIISRRYEKGSTIITSNRELSSWDKIFYDKTLTGAIIDRLIHHCHTFIIKGESYRYQYKTI